MTLIKDGILNPNKISKFLSALNPAWKLSDMKMMIDNHLKLTTDQAVQRIKKDYDADVIAYDKVHAEISTDGRYAFKGHH